jgi:hypothetical protein
VYEGALESNDDARKRVVVKFSWPIEARSDANSDVLLLESALREREALTVITHAAQEMPHTGFHFPRLLARDFMFDQISADRRIVSSVLVEEWCEGVPLDTFFHQAVTAKGRAGAVRDVCRAAGQATRAMEWLKAHGIGYADNLLRNALVRVDTSGSLRVSLVDFGECTIPDFDGSEFPEDDHLLIGFLRYTFRELERDVRPHDVDLANSLGAVHWQLTVPKFLGDAARVLEKRGGKHAHAIPPAQ